MNMFMLYSFGRLVERWIGTPMFALLVLVLAIIPNLFQGLAPEWMHGNPIFGGISGVLYGLLGFVWIRTNPVAQGIGRQLHSANAGRSESHCCGPQSASRQHHR